MDKSLPNSQVSGFGKANTIFIAYYVAVARGGGGGGGGCKRVNLCRVGAPGLQEALTPL